MREKDENSLFYSRGVGLPPPHLNKYGNNFMWNGRIKKIIRMEMSGGLGNNMFLYATGRAIAKQHGMGFLFLKTKKPQLLIKTFKKNILRVAKGVDLTGKQVFKEQLSDYFTLHSNSFLYKCYVQMLGAITPNNVVELKFHQDTPNNCIKTICLRSGPMSQAHFINIADEVKEWFTLKPKYQFMLDRFLANIVTAPHACCAIHVRRGDYLCQDKGFSRKGIGWSLPIEYYHHIIRKIGYDLHYIVCTDDYDYCSEQFKKYPCVTIVKDTPPAVDLHIFSRAKYNIIANSTFSWWGAWLNPRPDKVVYAPKYFIGWAKGTWYPAEIKYSPRDWIFVDIVQEVFDMGDLLP